MKYSVLAVTILTFTAEVLGAAPAPRTAVSKADAKVARVEYHGKASRGRGGKLAFPKSSVPLVKPQHKSLWKIL